jgi:predicted O-methyltransferase YrrM
MRAEDVDGYMLSEELDCLRQHAAKAQLVVEIGCWHGRSTYALAETCPGRIIAVDWFLGAPADGRQEFRVREAGTNGEGVKAEAAFQRNLAPFLVNGQVLLWKMESLKAARLFALQRLWADLLFIDGSHDEASVLADLDAWLPNLREGGVLLLHDRDYDGVQAAVALRLPLAAMQEMPGTLWKYVK